MIMKDKKVKELFEQELEIPDVVSDKMREAYKQIGADMEKTDQLVRGRRLSGHRARRYVKAASIIFCFLVAATTVSAAANGGFEKLSKLFKGDVKQVESSSAQPEVSSEKNSFKNLKVSVEQVLGTEEVTYMILKLKRTDGKTFDKDKNYTFGSVSMVSEEDMDHGIGEEIKQHEEDSSSDRREQTQIGEETTQLDEEESKGASSVVGMWIHGGVNDVDFKIDSESHFEINSGIMIENKGTDEIYMAVVYGYEREQDGKSYYHKGEKCTLLLSNLCEERKGASKTLMEGMAEEEFVLDYGECPQKVVETDKKIKLPGYHSNGDPDYFSAGILKRVTITPYYIQYERKMSEKEMESFTWEQIYVEMEDGTLVGYPTEKDNEAACAAGKLGGYGTGIKYAESSKTEMKDTLFFPELIDVEHVKAVWFGKTRIEVQ